MNRRRIAVVLALVLAVWLVPGIAAAEPPANDEFAGSVIIDPDALPFEATQDTTEATTSAADLAAASICMGPPATDAAVWYSITPTVDINLEVSTEGTDYSAGVLVFTGGPGAFVLDDCAPGSIQFSALAGVTHHLLIIDDQGDGGGNGGTLQLQVIDAGEELCPGIFANTLAEPGANVIIGTDDADVIHGTAGRDVIVGLVEAELWLRHDLLTGLCLFPIPFPIGANGIAYRHGDILVNNTEKAMVVRIPVEKGGTPGTPEVLAQVTGFDPDFGPPGLDGMALDVHGNIYVRSSTRVAS